MSLYICLVLYVDDHISKLHSSKITKKNVGKQLTCERCEEEYEEILSQHKNFIQIMDLDKFINIYK